MGSKVKCGSCKQYLDKTDAVSIGIQFFHPDHMFDRKTMSSSNKKDTPEDIKNEVLKLDSHACRSCLSKSKGLHVHHIVYRSEGGQHLIENLITLCFYCHDMVHSDKDKYQPLLKLIADMRSKGDKQITLKRLERANEWKKQQQLK